MQDVVAREEAVKQWSANPCGGVGGDETSLDYFLAVERSRYEQQPWQRARFQFEQYSDRRVLEIGVGLGTDLVQFAKAGAVCHGIDHRPSSRAGGPQFRPARPAGHVEEVRRRPDRVPGRYFDVVYSFGVIHHIPDAAAVLREIHRVLKPGGKCLIALYHTYSLFHRYMVLVRGILLGGLPRLGYEGLMATIEGGADGVSLKPYVKVYSRREARALLAEFSPVRVSVHQIELGRFRASRVGRLSAPILRRLAPLFGWYVVCEGVKPA